MIDVTDAALYGAALTELDTFKTQLGPTLRGRFVQIFLALKYHQHVLPSVQSGQFVSTEVLQSLIDDLYAKGSRAANDSILALFENGYHARTGLIGVGNTTPQNTWRNNFNIQKGVGCYGTPADLSNPAFLSQPRALCPYLQPSAPGAGLFDATCQLSTAGGTYRNEDHLKWLRIEPAGGGYSVVDLTNVPNFSPDVAPGGHRLPLLPVVVALYHDPIAGLPHSGRQQIDTLDFAVDFNFTVPELNAYFDDDPANPHNAALQAINPLGSQYTRFSALPAPFAPPQPPPPGPAGAGGAPLPPAPVLNGTQVAPPAVNTGFEAEEYVAEALRADGWTVHNVSRQKLGYDLNISRPGHVRYVDVKSSVGRCSVTMTAREWQQAQYQGARYVLAIIENFNPTATNTIFWVTDPANRCMSRQVQTVEQTIPRSSWSQNTVGLNQI